MPNWNVGAIFRGFQGHRNVAAEIPRINSYSFRVLRDGAPQRIVIEGRGCDFILLDRGSRTSKGQSIQVSTRAKRKGTSQVMRFGAKPK